MYLSWFENQKRNWRFNDWQFSVHGGASVAHVVYHLFGNCFARPLPTPHRPKTIREAAGEETARAMILFKDPAVSFISSYSSFLFFPSLYN